MFATIRVDVVARDAEIAATQQMPLPGMLDFAAIPAGSIEAVDPRQHFAEKLHALTRDYGNRPNTRIKDLADLVLLIESGLLADASLVEIVRHVFAVRATHPLPAEIPELPPSWRDGYPLVAESLTVTDPDLATAVELWREFWKQAVKTGDPAPTWR